MNNIDKKSYENGYEDGMQSACGYYQAVVIPERLTYLEEALKCEVFCHNNMKSDRGCDGGCNIDSKTLCAVLEVIHKAFDGVTSNL